MDNLAESNKESTGSGRSALANQVGSQAEVVVLQDIKPHLLCSAQSDIGPASFACVVLFVR